MSDRTAAPGPVASRPLDAAGITDPALRASYERCRQLHASYGRTYYLATRLLPPEKRPYVWALYGFAREADEYVDQENPDPQGLLDWGARVLADVEQGASTDPVAAALVDTIRRWDLSHEHFTAFLRSMEMDITVRDYATYADLETYMYGSAAVIGLQMVPILGPLGPSAYPRAHELGVAFQLTNFLRDIAEDLRRGRVYLPQEDLQRFGVTTEQLAAGVVDGRMRTLLAFQIERTRALYASAAAGIDDLAPSSRDCIRAAHRLYGGILDAIERANYDVFTRRVGVSIPRRLAVALPAWARARRARRADDPTTPTTPGSG